MPKVKVEKPKQKRKVLVYVLQLLGGAIVLWLLGYCIYTFAVI